jgi:ribosome-binding factor A
MHSYKRSERVADQIRRDAAEIINDMIRDKAGLLITVSGVDVSDDLRNARVRYTVLGDDSKIARAETFFQKAGGRIRSDIIHRLRIRRAPDITFSYDKSLVEGLRVTEMIDRIVSGKDDDADGSEADS